MVRTGGIDVLNAAFWTPSCAATTRTLSPGQLEPELRRLHAAKRWNELATLVVSQYGPDVLGFLVTLADYADACDAFAQASEDLWKGLPAFEGRSSLRTWFYTLARHALARIRRSPAVRKRASLSAISEQAERVRSASELHIRSEIRSGVSTIRAELPEPDRALLVLRVDRGMSWGEIARVLSDEEIHGEADASRLAARMRKRFQAVKQTIRERARQVGLISDAD